MTWPLLLALAASPDWVPSRWRSSDLRSLELLRDSPVNCLLLERAHWSAQFSSEAAKTGIATLGLVHPADELKELAAHTKAAGLAGIVFEGAFEDAAVGPARAALKDSGLAVVDLGYRTNMRLEGTEPVLGTMQGVWPGINATEDGTAKAAPSGAPWIDTNSGFLRFVRSISTARIWIAYAPPKDTVIPLARYLQAIGDAAMVGARWVLALDAGFEKRLLAREEAALKDWRRITQLLRFYEEHREWRALPLYGQLALVQDVESGGLVSGGILDMISVKHTPVRPVPSRLLSDQRMEGSRMAVNVDPTLLDEAKKEILRRFTRGGGTLLTAPPGWKFPPQRPGQITLDAEDIEKLDGIWKEVNSMTGRRNLGARLFNVSSILSSLSGPVSGKPLVLHMVNYSDYAVENVTAHISGKYTKAVCHEPGVVPRVLATYEAEDGTGVDIDKVSSVAVLVLE